MRRGRLSRDEVARYFEQGFLVVRGFVSARELRRMRSIYDRQTATPRVETNDAGEVFLHKLVVSEQNLPEYRDSVFLRRARAVGEQLLGASGRDLELATVLLTKPGRAARTGWHQHTPQNRPRSIVDTVTVWMPLEDVSAETGCMSFLAGSHLGPSHPHGYDAKILPRVKLDVKGRVKCAMSAGDVVLIHDNVIHGAEPNLRGAPRPVWSVYCCRHRRPTRQR